MATKIRLQRHGRKSYAFYQIVVADSRAPRDGKFIERIGSYNPNTNPATVDLNFERALYWLQVGAQPTDTTRNILSREGVCLKKHLLEGVKKGAFDEATAETKFQAWLKNKQASVQAVKDKDKKEDIFADILFFYRLYLSSRTFAEVKNARSYTRIGRSKSQHFQQKYIKTLFFQQEIIYLLYKLFF